MWELDLAAQRSWGWLIGGTCSALAIIISFNLIVQHLRNFTQPKIQLYIVRILLMVPIYAFNSFISLRWKSTSQYMDMLRDCYEAYVIYMFFNLLLAYINHSPSNPLADNLEERKRSLHEEDRDIEDPLESYAKGDDVDDSGEAEKVITILEAKPPQHHLFPFNHFSFIPPFQPGYSFLTWCRRGTYQFIVIKPTLAILSVILDSHELLGEGDFTPKKGYLYITIIENVSVTVSMYCLLLFYHVAAEELKPYKPMPKFICIKTVVAFAFWQGVIIAVLAALGILKGDIVTGWTTQDVTTGLQDFLICVEMFPIAIAHAYAFPSKIFRLGNNSLSDWLPCYACLCCCCCCCEACFNFCTVAGQGDVVKEGVDLFGTSVIRPKKKSHKSKINQDSTSSPGLEDGGELEGMTSKIHKERSYSG